MLECGGVELLLRCANLNQWPAIVTSALWNICTESVLQPGVDTGPAVEDDPSSDSSPKMSTIASMQLTLRSTGECDDSNGKSLLADEFENGRRQMNIVIELLHLAHSVEGRAWKEMAADLLDKASLFGQSISRVNKAHQAEIRSQYCRQTMNPAQLIPKI